MLFEKHVSLNGIKLLLDFSSLQLLYLLLKSQVHEK